MTQVKMPEPEVSLYVQCANGMQMPVRSYSKEQMQAYAQAVRDEALARQATVAHKAIDDAKALARTLYEEAQRLKAESNPDALASEREANAILTAEVEKLRKDAERYRYIKKGNQWIVAATQTSAQLDGEVLDDLIDSEMEQQK